MSASPLARSVFHPGPVAAPEAALDIIFIEGFVGHTVIGIHDSELHQTQPLVIDVQAGVPRPLACDTDRIGDTLDYGELRARLQRLLAEHRVQLLEAFAEAVAHIVLDEFRALWVRVKVAKPHKFDDVAAVGVQIERHAAPGVAARSAEPLSARQGAAVLRSIGTGMVPPAAR